MSIIADNKIDVEGLIGQVRKEIEIRKDFLRVQPEVKSFNLSASLLRMNQLREILNSVILEADEALNITHVKSSWPKWLNPLLRLRHQKNVDRRLIKSIQLLSQAMLLLIEEEEALANANSNNNGMVSAACEGAE